MQLVTHSYLSGVFNHKLSRRWVKELKHFSVSGKEMAQQRIPDEHHTKLNNKHKSKQNTVNQLPHFANRYRYQFTLKQNSNIGIYLHQT